MLVKLGFFSLAHPVFLVAWYPSNRVRGIRPSGVRGIAMQQSLTAKQPGIRARSLVIFRFSAKTTQVPYVPLAGF